ncbi:MAG: D-alanine--D-alanine ligase [Oscillospiraceae bacterium]|nr:D-alanine--D-alanine ligase [Oscillospiraceae bacterium]
MKKTVGILFGGVSSEHEVSCMSASSVISRIDTDRYDLVLVGITKDGRWLRYEGPVENIADNSWYSEDLKPCFLSPDRSVHGFIEVQPDGSVREIRVDTVFPVMHGKNGEDGTLQGLLMMAGIPFVGCDALASAVCMDKAVCNMLVDNAGIKRAEWRYLTKDRIGEFDSFADECEKAFGYPMFVKPANAGSSVGVSRAADRNELKAAADEAFRHDYKILAEREIVAQEIECAVMGNSEPVASVLGEVAPAEGFYDYDSKYVNGTSGLFIPARITEEKAEEIRSIAVKVYRLLGCSGLSRVDFLLERSTGIPYLNELNTLPGFTSISMYPKLFEASGVPYTELLTRLIELADERTEDI